MPEQGGAGVAVASDVGAHVELSAQNVTVQSGVAGVVENVNSFLSGIRASFRQDNEIVTTNLKQKTRNLNDGYKK